MIFESSFNITNNYDENINKIVKSCPEKCKECGSILFNDTVIVYSQCKKEYFHKRCYPDSQTGCSCYSNQEDCYIFFYNTK